MEIFLILILASILPEVYLSTIPDDARMAMENPDLFEGDIAGIDPMDKNVMVGTEKLWTNGVVYYQIHKSLEGIRSMIKQAMKEIESRTNNCITFKESKGSGKYIGFVGHKGCYSYVGMQRTSQVLSLGRGCHYVGTILHEIGHALGLHHEHNRSDRDKYIKIHFENIKPKMAYSCKKLRNSQNFILTGYDYQSIMQYGKYAFTANGNVTLEVLDKSKTLSNAYDRHNITDSDAFLLNSMYSCPGYTRPPPKRIPSYFCGFEDEKCNFRNAADFPKAKVVEEEGNHFLRADIPGADYRILTPYYRMINIDICIQFKYRIIGQLEYELYFAASQGSGYFDKEIGFEDTNGWKTMQIDFHPKSTYMMMLEPVIKSTGESKFDFDDISIKYTRC